MKSVDRRIEIESEAAPVKLVRKGRFLVAVPLQAGPSLTIEDVERVRQKIYEERAQPAGDG